jgi:hypothetical protein
MNLATSILLSSCLAALVSCGGPDYEYANRIADSTLKADSIAYAAILKAKSDSIVNPATFDFNGEWVGDIMTFVFSGDSAQLIVEGEINDKDWYRVDLDRTKNPMEMDFYTKFLKREELAFSMIVRITIAFGEDMQVRPSSFDPNQSVTCTKTNKYVH